MTSTLNNRARALELGYLYYRETSDGQFIAVARKMYTHSVLIGQITNADCFYDSHWCYTTREQAMAAAENWDPPREVEPAGWFRHPMTGRRRPQGDPSREFVAY